MAGQEHLKIFAPLSTKKSLKAPLQIQRLCFKSICIGIIHNEQHKQSE